MSGATLLRAGFQALMRDALNRRFDVVLAESLDRFSRDQEDTAGLFKRLTFAGVNIVTLAEGDITHLHIGFKGTMNALFLKDLAEKTHRGLRGRVEDAKSAGGLCYGYRVVKALNAGTVTTGEREIDWEQAAVANAGGRDELTARLAAADEPPPLLHPSMAELHRTKVTQLAEALERPESRSEATEILRGLIDQMARLRRAMVCCKSI